MNSIRAISAPRTELGESPVWCIAQQRLWWIDIRAPELLSLHPATGSVHRWEMPEVIGGIALRRDGGLVVALKDTIWSFDPGQGLSRLAMIEADLPRNRLNDARCDRSGNLWLGSMWDYGEDVSGALYRVDSSLDVVRVRADIRIPNALAISPGGDTLYFADTGTGDIEQASLDPSTGLPGPWRSFADAAAAPGRPDGATVDAQGYLWNARIGGGCLARFAPDGGLDRIVPLPVSKPTACAFGDDDLGTLYVTTATQRLSAEELAAEPLAGSLFSLRPGVSGLPETRFDA